MPVRLGMQIAFGRVRRKTEPTGPGDESVFLFLGFTIITFFFLSLVLQLIQPIIDTALL